MPNSLAAAKQRLTEPGTCFLYYFSVYVNLFKELFSFVANRCISEKRVQRYRLFQYPPNISAIIFQKRWIFDVDQAERGTQPQCGCLHNPRNPSRKQTRNTSSREQTGNEQQRADGKRAAGKQTKDKQQEADGKRATGSRRETSKRTRAG